MRKQEELEERIRVAMDHAAPNVLDRILSSCEEQKGNVIPMTTGKKNWKKQIVSFVSAAAAVCILFTAAMVWQPWNQGAQAVDSIVTLDVNPSVSLDVDENEKVVAVNALNEDGEAVIDGMNLEGTDLDVSINALIGSMLKNGYLNEAKNSILVTVENDDEEKGDELEIRIARDIEKVFSEDGLEAAVLSQSLTGDEELEQLAQEYGISRGKAALIREVIRMDPTLTYQTLSTLNVQEIALIYATRQGENSTVTQTGSVSEKSYVGFDAAKQTALSHAGVQESAVSRMDVEYDSEDGRMIYEVEFTADGCEYEYEIDAATGEVIRFEKKTDDDDDGDEEKSSYIGKEAAKTKAFAHAGVTASQAKYVEVELHGSVYEVEFVLNTTEYEYKINAQTGSVIHYEKDEKGNTSSVSGTSLIGEEQAKATAFSHAGVTASQVKYLEVELHGNAYEVEFHVGNTEYEYAIDAVSGTILRSEKKAD